MTLKQCDCCKETVAVSGPFVPNEWRTLRVSSESYVDLTFELCQNCATKLFAFIRKGGAQ